MMNKNNDPHYVARLEKAITKRWGKDAVQNPRKFWDDEKEESYKKQLKELHQKELSISYEGEKVEVDGFLMSKKLLTREVASRTCPVCSSFSFSVKDDVYMNKFDCCFSCYVKWVENREERWLDGWRPNKSGD